jgi:thioredoxin-like negative regulator of GroEL
MSAHKFVEDSAIFEDIDNRTEEVVPINLAHEAVRLGKTEAYQDILTLLNKRYEDLAGIHVDSELVLLGLIAQVKDKIK